MMPLQPAEHAVRGVDGRVLRLRVWQPAHAASLPALLMLDGQWLGATLAQMLPLLGDVPLMVASLGYSTPERSILRPWRARDYTPPAPAGEQGDPRNPQWPCGGAPRLLDVLRDDVLPLLAHEHGADLRQAALYGHSYAGLFATWAWLQQPALFSCIHAASPSLWWYWPHVLELLAGSAVQQPSATQPAPLHVCVGDAEHWRPLPAKPDQSRPNGVPTTRFAHAFVQALQDAGIDAVQLQVVAGQAHGPMLDWSARHCLQHAAARALGRPVQSRPHMAQRR